MLTHLRRSSVSIAYRKNTLSPRFPKRKRKKTMTYDYHLRSAVAAVFATTLTLLFAVITTTGAAIV
jgi:hypothetical protein